MVDVDHRLSLKSRNCLSVTMLVLSLLVFELFFHIQKANAEGYSDDSYYYNYNSNTNQESYGGSEYLSDWNNQEWAKLSGRIQQPKCVDIPSELTLCHGIGYEKMMLPNLLDHDTLNEVTQQAISWVPLTRINCHPDAKVFLCSLFSPVCLDRLIYPCRSLCQGVQAACVGRMKAYGFDWPEMLKCDKFPLDNDMCIKLIHDVKPDNNCAACKHALTHESMIDQFCRSNIAMRVSAKGFKNVSGHREILLHKKKTLFKHEGLTESQVLSLPAVIEGGASCSCDSINATQERYLLMGNKRGEQIVVTFGMVWNRSDKEFKKGIRAIQKGNTCEGIFRELSSNGIENKSSRKGGGDKKNKNNNSNNNNNKDKKGRKDKKGKGNKGKGKGRKKGRKDKPGKGKGKGKKNKGKKGGRSSNAGKERDSLSKSELEDRALNNFKRASN